MESLRVYSLDKLGNGDWIATISILSFLDRVACFLGFKDRSREIVIVYPENGPFWMDAETGVRPFEEIERWWMERHMYGMMRHREWLIKNGVGKMPLDV